VCCFQPFFSPEDGTSRGHTATAPDLCFIHARILQYYISDLLIRLRTYSLGSMQSESVHVHSSDSLDLADPSAKQQLLCTIYNPKLPVTVIFGALALSDLFMSDVLRRQFVVPTG